MRTTQTLETSRQQAATAQRSESKPIRQELDLPQSLSHSAYDNDESSRRYFGVLPAQTDGTVTNTLGGKARRISKSVPFRPSRVPDGMRLTKIPTVALPLLSATSFPSVSASRGIGVAESRRLVEGRRRILKPCTAPSAKLEE